jgi:hypothetical protein
MSSAFFSLFVAMPRKRFSFLYIAKRLSRLHRTVNEFTVTRPERQGAQNNYL